MRALDDLQVEKAREEAAERGEYEHGNERQAAAEMVDVPLGIAQFRRAEACRAQSAAPRREEQSAGQSPLGSLAPRAGRGLG